MNKKKLAMILSRLIRVEDPSAGLEQYYLNSERAAELVWLVYMKYNFKGKVVADLGCGNGILGFGALILGAKKGYFVDIDSKSVEVVKENKVLVEKEIGYELNCEIICCDIPEFKNKVDIVLENPPFGVQKEHADRRFLIKSFEISPVVYSLHKIESVGFVKKLSLDNEFIVKSVYEFDFRIIKSMKFHKKKEYFVRVGWFEIVQT